MCFPEARLEKVKGGGGREPGAGLGRGEGERRVVLLLEAAWRDLLFIYLFFCQMRVIQKR